MARRLYVVEMRTPFDVMKPRWRIEYVAESKARAQQMATNSRWAERRVVKYVPEKERG